MTRKPKPPREKAARALCRMAGNPENTMFEGRPMWESYLPEADAVLKAVEQESGEPQQQNGPALEQRLAQLEREVAIQGLEMTADRLMIDALAFMLHHQRRLPSGLDAAIPNFVSANAADQAALDLALSRVKHLEALIDTAPKRGMERFFGRLSRKPVNKRSDAPDDD